jgi:predicted MFS family arabinose efflux permease
VEESTSRNNPIPFLLLATGVGFLLGNWWAGLIVGIVMTLIPGVSLIALLINNLLLKIPLLIGFPFYVAYLGVRRVMTGRRSEP